MKRKRVHTECHSSWIPFRREQRKGGWKGDKRDSRVRRRSSAELETLDGSRVDH